MLTKTELRIIKANANDYEEIVYTDRKLRGILIELADSHLEALEEIKALKKIVDTERLF